MIRAAPFSFRDLIQYILPTLIGVALFSPHVGPLEIEIALFYVALFSYVIATPISRFVRLVYNHLPYAAQKIKTLAERRQWWTNNWDYDRLFYSLNRDEREYLYLTGAYVDFYRITSFYFLVYFFMQGCSLVKIITEILLGHTQGWRALVDAKTPMFGNWEFSTIAVAIISIAAFYFLFQDFAFEFELLFLENGQYVTFAQNYHEKGQKIAKSVWGCVIDKGHPVGNTEVILKMSQEGEPATTQADNDGWFQFIGFYERCLGGSCTLRVSKDNQWLEKEITLKPTDVPCVDLKF